MRITKLEIGGSLSYWIEQNLWNGLWNTSKCPNMDLYDLEFIIDKCGWNRNFLTASGKILLYIISRRSFRHLGADTQIGEIFVLPCKERQRNWTWGFEPHPKTLQQHLHVVLTIVATVHIGRRTEWFCEVRSSRILEAACCIDLHSVDNAPNAQLSRHVRVTLA
jgi:hypothetical protein